MVPTEHTSRVWLDLTFQNENASATYTKAIARFNRNRKILGLVSPDLSLDTSELESSKRKIPISDSFRDVTLDSFLEIIEAKHGIDSSYQDSVLLLGRKNPYQFPKVVSLNIEKLENESASIRITNISGESISVSGDFAGVDIYHVIGGHWKSCYLNKNEGQIHKLMPDEYVVIDAYLNPVATEHVITYIADGIIHSIYFKKQNQNQSQ